MRGTDTALGLRIAVSNRQPCTSRQFLWRDPTARDREECRSSRFDARLRYVRSMNGHVGNNWVPMAGAAVLFTGGAVAGVIAGENTGAVAAYFVVSTLVLVLLAAPWLVRHPPAINANTGTYLVLAVVLELGSLLGGAIESLRGLGAWAVLGIALAVYGWLERGRVIITSGVVAALASVGAIAASQPWLTVSLQLLTAAVFVTAAVRLRAMSVRRKAASR